MHNPHPFRCWWAARRGNYRERNAPSSAEQHARRVKWHHILTHCPAPAAVGFSGSCQPESSEAVLQSAKSVLLRPRSQRRELTQVELVSQRDYQQPPTDTTAGVSHVMWHVSGSTIAILTARPKCIALTVHFACTCNPRHTWGLAMVASLT
jgi:hypothetical protein